MPLTKLTEHMTRLSITKEIEGQSQAGSIKSGSSRRMKTSISKRSVNSRASSGRSLKLEAVAKTARLKMEMMFLERDSEM